VKRRDLLRHLRQHGCAFLREGGNHTLYINRAAKKVSTIPRHNEIRSGPRQKDLQGSPSAPASSELRWRIGCHRCRGPGSRGKRLCWSCGKPYVSRPREETVCLTRDIRERAARGEILADLSRAPADSASP